MVLFDVFSKMMLGTMGLDLIENLGHFPEYSVLTYKGDPCELFSLKSLSGEFVLNQICVSHVVAVENRRGFKSAVQNQLQ